MFDNLYASMVFTVAFLGSICALLFLLAWLEQPALTAGSQVGRGVLSEHHELRLKPGVGLQVAASWR
jgi:hypothetical protein